MVSHCDSDYQFIFDKSTKATEWRKDFQQMI